MLHPANYTIDKRVDATVGVERYAAVRRSDGTEVVIVRYVGDDAGERLARARREEQALRAAQGPGVPRLLELLTDDPEPLLVIERVPGISLASWMRDGPLSIDALLALGMQLASVLQRIHDAGILHLNVTPSQIRIDPAGFQTHLVGFGTARMLGVADRFTLNAEDDAATRLAYIAPEQTGRMARGVDSRSDLYSLGATLYFALTGKPPFESQDALALVHAHMARVPVPPHQHRSTIPETLSRIVMKLLHKEPSDRYQTAQGLANDLVECRNLLQRTGEIPDAFPLGRGDIPMRPLFPMRLYGREAEIQALSSAYQRVLDDRSVEMALLIGPAGAGKSALARELRAPLAMTGGYLAEGKFDLYRRDVPYSGFIAALESLVHQILSESEVRLTAWRTVLAEALGNLAAVVIELVPDLEIVLPDPRSVPRLGPREAQARLVLAIQRLVHACASKHPLVLFLDDLQWADPGSLAVLEALLTQKCDGSLLLLGAYRNEREPDWRPLADVVQRLVDCGLRVSEIAVPPLGVEAAAAMLADALSHPRDRIQGLAAQVIAKTGSNPLWIQQFILHVYELGLIRYVHPEGWVWDEAAIASADIPDGAVGLMIAKLERLAVRPRALLQFASCVGDEFEVELLGELTGEPSASLEPPLLELAKEGLIAPSPHGFRFAHDRVREAAQALLTDKERSRLHHRTGCHLLEVAPLAVLTDRVFEIADHLNRGLAHLSEEERHKALEVNVAAAGRALGAGASQTASAYLTVGRSLLEERDWQTTPDLAFRLILHAAEAAYQTREVELALELLDELDARPWTPVQQAQIAAKRIAYVMVNRPAEALPMTLANLRRFGMPLPANPSFARTWLEMAYTDWLLRGPLDAAAFGRKPTHDPAWVAPILILSAGASTIVRNGHLMLLGLGTIRSLRRLRANGAVPGIAVTLSGFVAHRVNVFGSVAGADRYVAAVWDWMQRMPSPLDNRARFSLYCFTLPFLQSRRSLIEPLERLAETAREVGDPEYALYIEGYRWSCRACCGDAIPALIEHSEQLLQGTYVSLAQRQFAAYTAIYEVLYRPSHALGDGRRDPPAVETALEDEVAGDASMTLHWLMVLCYLGRFERAAELLPRFDAAAFSINPSTVFDWMMFRAVCRAANAETQGRFARRRIARSLRWSLLLFQRRMGPESDFAHMLLGVRAEIARLRDRTEQALQLYQKAAKLAAQRGYVHHAALLCERRASLLAARRRDIEARAALRQAVELYTQWGARAKVRQLELRQSQ